LRCTVVAFSDLETVVLCPPVPGTYLFVCRDPEGSRLRATLDSDSATCSSQCVIAREVRQCNPTVLIESPGLEPGAGLLTDHLTQYITSVGTTPKNYVTNTISLDTVGRAGSHSLYNWVLSESGFAQRPEDV
jgi:hypothetical protein